MSERRRETEGNEIGGVNENMKPWPGENCACSLSFSLHLALEITRKCKTLDRQKIEIENSVKTKRSFFLKKLLAGPRESQLNSQSFSFTFKIHQLSTFLTKLSKNKNIRKLRYENIEGKKFYIAPGFLYEKLITLLLFPCL